MSHEPKLEICKFTLFKKEDNSKVAFREFFRKKFHNEYAELPKPIIQNDILNLFYKDFIKAIDNNDYHLNHKKKKGFKVAKNQNNGNVESQLNFHHGDFAVSGILDGGKHDVKRWMGDTTDVNVNQIIQKKNIVNDRYFFLIYTPLNHFEGILMIQSYSEISISDIFKEFVNKYFVYFNEVKNEIESYIPDHLRQEYLEGATYKSIRFTTDCNIAPNFNGDIEQEQYHLQVRIEIINKSDNQRDYSKLKDFFSKISKSKFMPTGGNAIELEDFKEHKGILSDGKPVPIVIDEDTEIKPIIRLKEQGIAVDDGNVPDFEQIKNYCLDLLHTIQETLLPENAVEEL
ncbi:MAG: hypothetical protein KG003_15135 [Bacteroidetes bacterium]|nr:hypothetical protein [Bacteroidota bacterium]